MTAYNYYYSNGAAYYLAGFWGTSGSVSNSGTSDGWWSNTSSSSDSKYSQIMYADTSSVNSQSSFDLRYNGNSVRCVLNASGT